MMNYRVQISMFIIIFPVFYNFIYMYTSLVCITLLNIVSFFWQYNIVVKPQYNKARENRKVSTFISTNIMFFYWGVSSYIEVCFVQEFRFAQNNSNVIIFQTILIFPSLMCGVIISPPPSLLYCRNKYENYVQNSWHVNSKFRGYAKHK